MLPVAATRNSSDDNAIHYVRPVLWMTSHLHIMRQIYTVTRQVAPLNCTLGMESASTALFYK